MREILTQEEVDALLEAYDKGEIEDASSSAPGFYTPFDFHSSKPIADAHQIVIETIQDGISKGIAVHLSGALHHEVKVTPSSSYTETAAGFLSNFKGPSCVGLIAAYMIHVLRSARAALAFGAALGSLYAMLYALLQAEDYSLLGGSLLLFTLLAGAMIATRRIDWYGLTSSRAA